MVGKSKKKTACSKKNQYETSLYIGGIVYKDDIRVEICGTLDELGAHLGYIKSLVSAKSEKKLLDILQRNLFLVCSEIVCLGSSCQKLPQYLDQTHLDFLEHQIDKIEKKYSFAIEGFYVTGNDSVSSAIDITRTVARRAERRLISFARKHKMVRKLTLTYMNRLSDLLYLFARSKEKRHTRFKDVVSKSR